MSKQVPEQYNRNIKWVAKTMMGFKEFHVDLKMLDGIELWRMTKKGQLQNSGNMTATEHFYTLAT